jgi:3',5'-cyclic AMP phosphodiesterase CpdA
MIRFPLLPSSSFPGSPNRFLRGLSAGALALLALAPSSRAATNLTFYAISDTHYGQHSAAKDTNRVRMLGILNNLPGTELPASIGGGPLAAPRGVLVAGDLTERIDTALWREYTDDYGVSGDKKLLWPTYEAMGNHEFYTTGTIKDTLYNVNRMIQRNIARRATFTDMDSTGYHYSWDWEGVHFINLNLYAGSTELGYSGFRPMKAKEFMIADLAKNVGSSGRPVFLMQHYMLRANSTVDWTDQMKSQIYAILQNYNVIGILHGHSHTKQVYKWNGIDIFDDGTVMNGEMMVFHISDGNFRMVNRVNNAWGTLTLQKTISMGEPLSARNNRMPASAAYRNIIFAIPDVGWNQQIPATVRRIEIANLQGRKVRVLAVRNSRIEWNRKDAYGQSVPAGLYVIREEGTVLALGKVLLP